MPSTAVTVALPVLKPLHVTGVFATVAAKTIGCVIVVLILVEQPLLSVTTQAYTPCG